MDNNYVDFLHGAEEIIAKGYEDKINHFDEVVAEDIHHAVEEGTITEEEADCLLCEWMHKSHPDKF